MRRCLPLQKLNSLYGYMATCLVALLRVFCIRLSVFGDGLDRGPGGGRQNRDWGLEDVKNLFCNYMGVWSLDQWPTRACFVSVCLFVMDWMAGPVVG
jgi:hypothetical protein